MKSRPIDLVALLNSAIAGNKKSLSALHQHLKALLCPNDGKFTPTESTSLLCKTLQTMDLDRIHNGGSLFYLARLTSLSGKNIDITIALYEKGIALGDAGAMNNRAVMHENGEGGPVDLDAAIALYEKAIALTHTDAMTNRAIMHRNGEGGPVDLDAAIALYEKAITQGHANAMNNRAVMHENGEGGPVDLDAAIALYEKAITQGHANAMFNRALSHKNGKGGPVDLTEAAHLYRRVLLGSNSNEDLKNKTRNQLQTILAKSSADNLHTKYHCHMAINANDKFSGKFNSFFAKNPDEIALYLLSDDLLSEQEKQQAADFIGDYYINVIMRKYHDNAIDSLDTATSKQLIDLLYKVPEHATGYTRSLVLQTDILFNLIDTESIQPCDLASAFKNFNWLLTTILDAEKSRLQILCSQIEKIHADNNGALDEEQQGKYQRYRTLIDIIDQSRANDVAEKLDVNLLFTGDMSEVDKMLLLMLARKEKMDAYAGHLKKILVEASHALEIKSRQSTSSRLWQPQGLSARLKSAQQNLIRLKETTDPGTIISIGSEVAADLSADSSAFAKQWLSQMPPVQAKLQHEYPGDDRQAKRQRR